MPVELLVAATPMVSTEGINSADTGARNSDRKVLMHVSDTNNHQSSRARPLDRTETYVIAAMTSALLPGMM